MVGFATLASLISSSLALAIGWAAAQTTSILFESINPSNVEIKKSKKENCTHLHWSLSLKETSWRLAQVEASAYKAHRLGRGQGWVDLWTLLSWPRPPPPEGLPLEIGARLTAMKQRSPSPSAANKLSEEVLKIKGRNRMSKERNSCNVPRQAPSNWSWNKHCDTLQYH